jgi:hypothetical protein
MAAQNGRKMVVVGLFWSGSMAGIVPISARLNRSTLESSARVGPSPTSRLVNTSPSFT